MARRLIFSTGTIYIGAQGNTALNDSDQVFSVQDVTFTDKPSREESFEAASINVSAIDAQDSELKTTMSFTAEDIAFQMLPFTSGAASRSVTVADVARHEYTAGALSVPPYCRVEFHGVDTEGNAWAIVGTLVKFMGTDISLKRKGYASQKYECDFYFDPNATSPSDSSDVPTRYFVWAVDQS